MPASLQAEAVGFRYADHNDALRAVSMQVHPGEAWHIAGPSGCGKSTLARCLTGLIPHLYAGELTGTAEVGGLDTRGTPLWTLCEHVGLVFQNPAEQMLCPSVEEEILFGLENLGLSAQEMKQRLELVLQQFDLTGLRNRAPQCLSGGEQQKLALAAIMARQPEVLVLDEPLSMLDTTAAQSLVEQVGRLVVQGTTAVICEHRADPLQQLVGLRTLRLPARAPVGGLPPDPGELCWHSSACTLHVTGLNVHLDGHQVLRDLSLDAPSGQIVAIVGRNGIGKTTLMRALAGLQPFEGAVLVDGAMPQFGMVFQNADLQLFNPTVREEILYRLPAPDLSWYRQLLALLSLESYEQVPPLLLSEGEKKRVALATVLMRKPRHGLLLDEPAIGQDTAHKDLLVAFLRCLADCGHLVLITTHDLTLAAQADRLLLLGANGFLADGAPTSVFAATSAWADAGLLLPAWLPLGKSSSPAVLVPIAAEKTSVALEAGTTEKESPAGLRIGIVGRVGALRLRNDSPLRQVDPRTKLVLSLGASLAVMLPLLPLTAFVGLYVGLLAWARLLPEARRQVWRLRWILVVLFIVDWLVVGPELAVIVTLRLALLAGAFTVFFATTTPTELQLALESLGIPYRFAFSVSLAFQSVGMLDDGWRSIAEAQRARGAWVPSRSLRQLAREVRHLMSLTVPAVVLTVKRAWSVTEAAHARGFESPRRVAYRRLRMSRLDWVLLGIALLLVLAALWTRSRA